MSPIVPGGPMADASSVPRILALTGEERAARGEPRFALLHVVSGGRHHIGWFQLSDDPWRVGLVEAGAVADAGVPAGRVRAATEDVLGRLRAAHDAGDDSAPEPIAPVTDPLRLRVDRRRAIGRLEAELEAL